MSATRERRELIEATEDGLALMRLVGNHFFDWRIAGSVRRRVATVGDVEHVIVPGPAFIARLDALVEAHAAEGLFVACATADSIRLRRAIYPDGRTRWGLRYRGLVFRGFRHELFMATMDNVGALLAIRTGPAHYSRELVTKLRDRGVHRMEDGHVVDARTRKIVSVTTEEQFFALCGVEWIEPSRRGA